MLFMTDWIIAIFEKIYAGLLLAFENNLPLSAVLMTLIIIGSATVLVITVEAFVYLIEVVSDIVVKLEEKRSK